MGIPAKTRVTLASADGGGPRREFSLSRRATVLLAALFLILLVVAVLQLGEALIAREQRATIDELERQLAETRDELLKSRIAQAELEQTRLLQEELMVMLGVPRSDSLSALADTLCDVPPVGVSVDVPPAPEAATAPPSRWPAAGVIIREFTHGDSSAGVEEHRGVDIAGEVGDPVVAAAEGDVDFVGTDEVLGNYLEIRHGLDYVTIYGHCSWVGVGPGHRVRAGEKIAKMGHSGQTAITQLHFEVWKRGEAVDPRKILAGEPAPR